MCASFRPLADGIFHCQLSCPSKICVASSLYLTRWTAWHCFSTFFKHLRSLGPRGFNLYWGTWDHAIADFIGDSYLCRSAAYYLDIADETERDLQFMKDWNECVHCPLHDVQLMFSYGLMHFLKTTEEHLRNVWCTIEAFRGGFADLMERLHGQACKDRRDARSVINRSFPLHGTYCPRHTNKQRADCRLLQLIFLLSPTSNPRSWIE